MAFRPLVQVWSGSPDGLKTSEQVKLPAVFTAPIRDDIVRFVHKNMNKNHRQAHSVSKVAGHQTSAESWGTGRAVARIPRVPGGGTHRAGQGAFGNMCRGGRMFAPTKTWRKWHKKTNQSMRRHAVCSALAASALPALVMARGHRVEKINEVPLVLSNELVDGIAKTKQAVALLKSINAYDDVQKVVDTKHIRAGKGKMRNRRYVQRKGPLVIYNQKNTLVQAMRNIPGVDIICVTRLNLLRLAPGGHIGRFCIWVKDAFEKLDELYGTYEAGSAMKAGYHLQRPLVSNGDIQRIINSDEVQSSLRPRSQKTRRQARRKNPLKNYGVMVKLNPYAEKLRRDEILNVQKRREEKAKVLEARRKGVAAPKKEKKAKHDTSKFQAILLAA